MSNSTFSLPISTCILKMMKSKSILKLSNKENCYERDLLRMQVSLFNDWRKNVVQSRKIELLIAEGRYTVVDVEGEEVLSDKSLGEWEQELESEGFVRIHKSYIVNLRYVAKVESTVVLKDGTSVPLARRRKKEFEERYKEYLMRDE